MMNSIARCLCSANIFRLKTAVTYDQLSMRHPPLAMDAPTLQRIVAPQQLTLFTKPLASSSSSIDAHCAYCGFQRRLAKNQTSHIIGGKFQMSSA